jgi:hypothetical protein
VTCKVTLLESLDTQELRLGFTCDKRLAANSRSKLFLIGPPLATTGHISFLTSRRLARAEFGRHFMIRLLAPVSKTLGSVRVPDRGLDIDLDRAGKPNDLM